MAALPYTRSAFAATAAVSSAAASRLSAARRWAALTGTGLALPLLLAGPAVAAVPGDAVASAHGAAGQAAGRPTVQQVLQQVFAAFPAIAISPAVQVAPVLPTLPVVPRPPVTVVPSEPADPTESRPPTSEPTRSTPTPPATPDPSPSASASPSPSPSAPPSPSATPAGPPARWPHGEGGIRHQPALAPVPEEPELSDPLPDPADTDGGEALPPTDQPDDSAAGQPATPDAPSHLAARPETQAQAAVPLHWTDPSALQLPLGAGLTMIGAGLALVGLRLRRR